MKKFSLALFLINLGCSPPTGPTLPEYIPLPSMKVKPFDANLQVIAEHWWTIQASCVGVEFKVIGSSYPINVYEEAIDCSGIKAAGCMQYTSISVMRRWFEPAISHEFIHFALWKKGGEEIGHSNPAFAKCDTLNYRAGQQIDVE